MVWGPHISDPGSQTGPTQSTVSGVKPTSDMTPARPDAVEGLAFASPATKRAAETIYGELEASRVVWGWKSSVRRPGMTPATTLAIAGARVSSGSLLQWPSWGGASTYGSYAMRGVQWAQARDHMVTGAPPATSAGSGVCG